MGKFSGEQQHYQDNQVQKGKMGEGAGAGECNADYVQLSEAADTAYSLIGEGKH